MYYHKTPQTWKKRGVWICWMQKSEQVLIWKTKQPTTFATQFEYK
jgi:hypothetical protein